MTDREATLRRSAHEVLVENWRDPGFTCPNPGTYPWLWLWDSCFHSIVWAALGHGDRAAAELGAVFRGQHADGFVPHMVYFDGDSSHEEFWWGADSDSGRNPGAYPTSSITQPPIYGHSIATLTRNGVDVADEIVERAVAGFEFLLERRRRSPAGLVEIVHPWESGCDHSPRWDDVMFPGSDELASGRLPSKEAWAQRKGELLASVVRDEHGSPVSNPDFAVGSVAFSALVAWSCSELAVTIGHDRLRRASDELASVVLDRWEPEAATWVDDGPTTQGSGRYRTTEALLPLLLGPDDDVSNEVCAQLVDPGAFGGEFGPAQVHRDEPTRSRGQYWRGPSWPQLDYLLWRASGRVGSARTAEIVAAGTVRGAVASGWSEYWESDDGRGGGARPQSWSTLAVLMADPHTA